MKKIVIAYIPIIHQGYLDFLKKVQPDILYVLGEDFLKNFRPTEKDIRRLPPQLIVEQLKVCQIGIEAIEVLDQRNLSFVKRDTRRGEVERFLPHDDISHLFAEQYLQNQNVEFIDYFLRWDTEASLKQKDIQTKLTLNPTSFAEKIFGLAYGEAAKSADFWRQVGAVVVKNKEILLSAYNKHVPSEIQPYFLGDPRGNFKKGIHIELSTALHAEAGLIAEAAKHGISLQDTDMYVTTFPCPPCAKLIAYSGIKTLYFAEGYAMLDGEEILKSQEVEIVKVELSS